jgi:hypothetical protein
MIVSSSQGMMFQQDFDQNFKYVYGRYAHGGEEWERKR